MLTDQQYTQLNAQWKTLFAEHNFDPPRIVGFPDIGWWLLIKNILSQLHDLGLSRDNCIIDQTKEKFGGLRFYFSGFDHSLSDDIWRQARVIVDDFEQQSYTICEQCGQPGVLRRGPWLLTLCDEHADGRLPDTDLLA